MGNGNGSFLLPTPRSPPPKLWFDKAVIPVIALINHADTVGLRVSEDQKIFGRLSDVHHRLFGRHRLNGIPPGTDDARVVSLRFDWRRWAWRERARRRRAVFAGNDFIIAGEMLKDRKQVTKEKIDALKAESLKTLIPQLDSVAAITYSPAKSKTRKIYMITDPLCPYCGIAGEKIIPLADTYGVIVKTVLYSVHGMEGENKSVEAVCRKFTLNQYVEKEWKALPFDERYQCDEGEQLIEATREVIGKAGIAGVPAFIFDTGQFVSGANMTAVEGILKNMD